MIESLLAILIAVVWLAHRPLKDWYVVEWRTCSDGSLCAQVFSAPPRAFDRRTMRASKVSVDTLWTDAVTLRQAGGGRFTITQTVFAELDAALLDVERFKRLLPFNAEYPFQKLYVWRVVARSRKAALMLPPRNYLGNEAYLLLEYPHQSWFSGKGREPAPSTIELWGTGRATASAPPRNAN